MNNRNSKADCQYATKKKNRDESTKAMPSKKEKKKEPSQTEQLIQLTGDCDFFCDAEYDNPYVMFMHKEHSEIWPIKSKYFKMLMYNRYYNLCNKTPASHSFSEAVSYFESKACFESDKEKVFTRIGEIKNKIYIDLCNTNWSVIEIDENGWRVTSEPKVKFRRSKGMQSLPMPKRNGSISSLRNILNMNHDQFILAMSWVVGAIRCNGPYPILQLRGEQGTGKSTQSKIIRSILDPNSASARSLPRNERDLLLGANNSWILAFDNLSSVPDWISDALCRLSTGGGFSCRELFSDLDETIISAQRPMIINGINNISNRHDLIDRCIICELNYISKRRTEKDIWKEFNYIHPYVLGSLCDSISFALKNIKNISMNNLPRMADFACWVMAAEDGLPWSKGSFMDIFNTSRQNAVFDAIFSDCVAKNLLEFCEHEREWTGTASELLRAINRFCENKFERLPDWPKTGAQLGKRITRAQANLRAVGVGIHRTTRQPGKVRLLQLKMENTALSA